MTVYRDDIPVRYENYFETIFNNISPNIAELLNEDVSAIKLRVLKIIEYKNYDNNTGSASCKSDNSMVNGHHIDFDFSINRSFMNLIGNIWCRYGILVERYNSNPQKCDKKILKDIAKSFNMWCNGEILPPIDPNHSRAVNAMFRDYLMGSMFEFILYHEIGHAILKYCENERIELEEAIRFLNDNPNLGYTDETFIFWANELAADYISLKLFYNHHHTKMSDNSVYMTQFLYLFYLTPIDHYKKIKKIQDHPPFDIRLCFLVEKAIPPESQSFIEQSLIGNLYVVSEIIEYIEKHKKTSLS